MKDTLFPNLIAVHLPVGKSVTPFAAKVPDNILNAILNLSIKGTVTKEGKFDVVPSPGWMVNRSSLGVYKVVHGIGKLNTSLSVFLIVQPGSFDVVEHHKDYFVVATKLNGKPTDLDFGFTFSPVIDQPA